MNRENLEHPETCPELARGSFRTEDLIKEESISSFLCAVPNNLGINLCNLENVDFIAENDEFGQLVSLKLNFRPMQDKSEENLHTFKLNHGYSWAEWIKNMNKKMIVK